MIQQALLSVSNKTGIVEFERARVFLSPALRITRVFLRYWTGASKRCIPRFMARCSRGAIRTRIAARWKNMALAGLIGGPAMLRAAAKNYRDVTVVTDPDDYETLLAEIRANGNAVSSQTRFRLAAKAFAHTAQYDGAITNYLTCLDEAPPHASCCAYPAILNLSFEKVQDLRYGENPHQQAAFYRDLNMP